MVGTDCSHSPQIGRDSEHQQKVHGSYITIDKKDDNAEKRRDQAAAEEVRVADDLRFFIHPPPVLLTSGKAQEGEFEATTGGVGCL